MADQRISELDAKITIADTDLFAIMDEEATPDQTKKITGANLKSQILAELIDYIDKTHLSQDFGASSARLRNLILTPIAGEIFRIGHAAASPFSAVINGAPTATSVVYDGEANENMLNTLEPYDGTNFWGKIILHNTTRGNSRKIEAVNIATNTITTESSTDDWANNDVITVQSTTNTYAGYFDVDLSDKIPATTAAILLKMLIWNQSAEAANMRGLYVHPFEERNIGKEVAVFAALASEVSSLQSLLPVISQKCTVRFRSLTDHYIAVAVQGYAEYADT